MTVFFTSGRRRAGFVAAMALLSLALAGCGDKKEIPPCPGIVLLADTAKFTEFRPGGGRDVTDIVLQGEMTGYKGACTYNKKAKQLTVTLQVQMAFTKGPAATGPQARASYYVAVPSFFPKPEAKQILGVQFAFASTADHVQITDNEIDVVLPVADFDKDLPNREIFVGFQLDQDELDYNRREKQK